MLKKLDTIGKLELTRKEFLGISALFVASLVGLVGILEELKSHATTPTASLEPEKGKKTGGAKFISDTTASNNAGIMFGTAGSWTPRFAGDLPPGHLYVGNSLGPSPTQAVFEARLGKKSALHREYYIATDVDAAATYAGQCLADGVIPVLSFKTPVVGGGIQANWQAVADGTQDAWLKSIRDKLAAKGGPIWVSFHHEPRGDGPASVFRAMYDNAIYRIFDVRKDVLTVAPILNGFAFFSGEDPKQWAPNKAVSENRPVWVDYYEQWWTYDKTLKFNFNNEADGLKAYRGISNHMTILQTINSWGCPTGLMEWGVHYQWGAGDQNVAAKFITDLTAAVFDPSLDIQAISAFQSDQNSPRGGWRFDAYTKAEANPANPGHPKPPSYITETSRVAPAAAMWARTSWPTILHP